MKRIVATAAVAVTLLSASVSEAAYQSVYGAAFNPVGQEEPATQEVAQEPQETVQESQVPVSEGTSSDTDDEIVEQYPPVRVMRNGDAEQAAASGREMRRQRAVDQGLARVTAIGYADIGDRAGAMDDAQRNAVENVLSTLIQPDSTPGSTFQTIADQYDKYVIGFSITGTDETSGMLEMHAKVTVNTKALKEAVDEMTKPAPAPAPVPDANISNTPSVGVLVRFIGSRDSHQANELTSTAYRNSMEMKNLNMVEDDALLERISTYGALSFEDFSTLMKQYASSAAGMKFAIIGEVLTESVLADNTGVTQRASVNMVLYDLVNNRHLGNMKEDYFARGVNGAEAEPAVLKKAASESSRILAQEISRYIDMTKASKI